MSQSSEPNFLLPELDYEPDGACLNAQCENPICPEHGDMGLWVPDELEHHTFFFINGILIAELDAGRSISGATGTFTGTYPVTVQPGDLIEMREFCGPVENYETWRE